MSKGLLYNITGEKLAKIRIAAAVLGHEVIEVPPESFGHPLGYLLGLEGGEVWWLIQVSDFVFYL